MYPSPELKYGKNLLKSKDLDEIFEITSQGIITNHDNPSMASFDFAVAGSILLIQKGYVAAPCVGSLEVEIGDDPGDGQGPFTYSIDAEDDEGGKLREFHTWIEVSPTENEEASILDFSSKFLAQNMWEEIHNNPQLSSSSQQHLKALEPYYLAHEEHDKIYYEPHPELTESLQDHFFELLIDQKSNDLGQLTEILRSQFSQLIES